MFYRTLVLFLAVQLGGVALGTAQVLVPTVLQDQPIELKAYQIEVEVVDQLAQVTITQVFFNPNPRVLEGTYLFPLPSGAAVSALTLCQQDRCTEGRLLDADQARATYRDIVRRTLDPALLQWVGERAFEVRVFPIPAQGEQTVVVRYQQLLPRQGNTVALVLPSGRGAERVSFRAQIESRQPLAGVFSPSQAVRVEQPDENHLSVRFEASGQGLPRDLALYYTLAQEGMGFDVLAYRSGEEAGYFTLMLSPALEQELERLPKDIVFVFDVSGSMRGEKLEQAKAALSYALERLDARDRFAVVTFSDALEAFSPELVAAGAVDRARLERFVRGISAGGSTDLDAALQRGLAYFEEAPERLKLLVFLTDGLPTAGETEPARILARAAQANGHGARLFAFGVGYDVNAHLLDRLSAETGGTTTYVTPGQSVERAVSAFYDQVGTPLLADLKLDFGGAEVFDLYPRQLPDLFRGSQLQLFGRYRQPGPHTVTLRGRQGDERVEYAFEVTWPAEDPAHRFLPRIWATRKVAHLLGQIRLYGEDPELVESVKDLALRFGIVTPYTSFLADPQEPTGAHEVLAAPQAMKDTSGAGAVRFSRTLRAMSESTVAAPERATRWIDGTLFVRDGQGVWRPQGLEREPEVVVRFGSEAYFWLAERAQLEEALSLGADLVVRVNGQPVHVARDQGLSDPRALADLVPTGPASGNPERSAPDRVALPWWGWLGVALGAVVGVVLLMARR